MKRHVFTCIKYTILIFIICSSSLALYVHYKGSNFDPIKEIQKLRNENRRDEALDLATFYLDNQIGDTRKIEQLEQSLEYTPYEKAKSFGWNGAIKGEVYDTYSGLGAITADIFIFGDIRDLGIQSWLYITDNPDFDKLVLILSAAGIGLTSTYFMDGANTIAKNIIKYVKRVPDIPKRGLLKKVLSGRISIGEFRKIWDLLKKTIVVSQRPQAVSPTSTI